MSNEPMTDEAALAILDAVIQRSGHVVACDVVQARTHIASRLRSAAEPVAWKCEWDGGWTQFHDASDPMPEKWDDPPSKITPYFAAPPPAATGADDAMRRDAERYRWLKRGGWEVLQDPKYWRPELKFDGAVDAARIEVAINASIDSARAEGGE